MPCRQIRESAVSMNPIHKSGSGTGGHCFIKNFATFSEIYQQMVGDEAGSKILDSLKDKNIELLFDSNKDLNLLAGVYGKEIINSRE